ncbi:hypothetical protein BGZ81_005688 [Podila clonocystis]|nr:hypothetical protein BGZ81_005688 [Podila clonocystis]
MPFPTTSSSLMESVMGGGPMPTMPSASVPGSSNTSPIKKKDRESTVPRDGTVRLFYSLKENPNAIISYSELLRQEQRRQRLATSKNHSTTTNPLRNPKVTSTHTQASGTSSTAMDVDPPEGEKAEGEEALGEGDSEAEDEDDDEDDEENENEDDAEAEDEDDDEDPDDEDDDDGPSTGPRSFLDTLAEKYVEENGNEGEDEDDEDEDDDGEPRVKKKSSRWDHEYYDIEDDFIDDSEAMAESIGMLRPKVDGFFVYRGPVETTNEDPGGSRSRRSTKKKPAAGASPLSTGKSIVSRIKSSNLTVAESANDSTSEMSEMEDKPRAVATTSATEGSTSTLTGGESKKKVAPSKTKVLVKEGGKDTDGKDSDKESKSGVMKKARTKPKVVPPTSALTSSTAAVPTVRVDSPALEDPNPDHDNDDSAPPPIPSRSSSPSKSKPAPKPSPPITEADSSTIPSTSEVSSSAVAPQKALPAAAPRPPAAKSTPTPSEGAKHKAPKVLEPLNPEVKLAYDVVVDLARSETWEVKTKFPPHIKPPLFECARLALSTRTSGYVLDDSFFVHLQAVLPYNKFTLKKLIYRNVLPQWIEDLEAQKAKYISMFTTRAGMVWKSSGLSAQVDAEGDTPMEEEGRTRKFPWTQDLRLLLWEVMEKFMEILAAKSELHSIDDTLPVPPSESKTRKDAYQMLLPAFPPKWMTSYEISRQYSQLKEKVQKQERKESESAATASASKTGLARVPASALRSNVSPGVETVTKQTITKPTTSPSVPVITGAPSTSLRNPDSTASSSATLEEGGPKDHTVLDPMSSANKKRKVAEAGSGPAGSNQNDPITIDETPNQKTSQGASETQTAYNGQGPPHTGSTAEYQHTALRKTESQVSAMYSSPYPSSDPLKKMKTGSPATTNKAANGAPTSPGVTPTGAYRRSPVMGHPNYSGQPVSPVMHPSSSPSMSARSSQHPSYQHSYSSSPQQSRQQHYSQPGPAHHRLPSSPEMSFSSGPKGGGASHAHSRGPPVGGQPTHEPSMRSGYTPYSSRPGYQGPIDELFSDAFPMKEHDGVIEIDCQMIQVKQGADVDVGANASAEEAGEEVEDGVETVNNVVHSFRLHSTSFDKKQYGMYLKGYMKAVKAKIQEAAAKDGKDADAIVKAFEVAYKKILANFKEYEFYVGESMDPDGAVMLLNYREDGVTPYFTVFKDGLNSIKLVDRWTMPQNDVPNLPRELISCIASLLEKSDLTRCVRVSRQWLQVFIPELWYAFDDGQTSSSGQTFGEELEDLNWLEPALKNYGHHIRHLTINSARTVEILASHPHICQDLICVAVPQMRRFKLPATYIRNSKQGWEAVPGARPQMHQKHHPRLNPDEADLDEMIKAVVIDPRFGDGAFQLSGKWLTDNDEA